MGVADLVAFLSAFVTLRPGDVILTGTPTPLAGRLSRLSPDDIVEAEIAVRLSRLVVTFVVVVVLAMVFGGLGSPGDGGVGHGWPHSDWQWIPPSRPCRDASGWPSWADRKPRQGR